MLMTGFSERVEGCISEREAMVIELDELDNESGKIIPTEVQ